MEAARRSGQTGLTLVEILLSMLVFIVGIVGVLALFPTALQTSRRSIGEQRATMLAESVKNALSQALRTLKSQPAPPAPAYAIFTHDFRRVDAAGNVVDQQIYGENNEFPLPGYTGSTLYSVTGILRHPGNYPPTATPEVWTDPQVFLLMGDGWMTASRDYVVQQASAPDPGENYDKWSFAFDVWKSDTMPWLTNLLQKDQRGRLYEFAIYVLQRRPILGTSTSATWENRLVLRVSDRVAMK